MSNSLIYCCFCSSLFSYIDDLCSSSISMFKGHSNCSVKVYMYKRCNIETWIVMVLFFVIWLDQHINTYPFLRAMTNSVQQGACMNYF